MDKYLGIENLRDISKTQRDAEVDPLKGSSISIPQTLEKEQGIGEIDNSENNSPNVNFFNIKRRSKEDIILLKPKNYK